MVIQVNRLTKEKSNHFVALFSKVLDIGLEFSMSGNVLDKKASIR